jgi:DNA-binding ferritin-like protein (Dps family)
MMMHDSPIHHCANCEALAAELASVKEDRDLWKQTEGGCSAQYDKLSAENERLRDEVVELWHQAPSEDRSLQECLGMDIDQYVAWANPKQETKP